MRKFLITLSLLALKSFGCFSQNIPETVPNFIFFNLDNTPFTNRSLAVDKEILFIFFDVTCDHCQHAIKILSTRSKECEKIAIYLISLDDRASVNKFMTQYGENLAIEKNVTILQDLMNQFIKQFKPKKYPSVYLYSSEKKLILHDEEDQNLEKLFAIIKTSEK
jgi:peroxiredoxin